MFRRGKIWYFTNPVTKQKESSGTPDKARAAQLLRDLQNEAFDRKTGRYVEKWEGASARWMMLNQHLSNRRSQEEYAAFWAEYLDGKRLNEIDEELVHQSILIGRKGRYAVDLKQRTSANSTANLYVGFVAKILRFGKVTPPAFYKYPASKKSKPVLWPEQWPALREAMETDLRRAVTYGLASGLRIDNIINFRWSWLQANDTRAFLPIEVTKTDEDYGIPINATGQAVFAEIRRDVVRHPTHVFIHNGKPWEYATLLKALKVACKRAGLPILTPHSLRHTFASWLTLEGVSDAIRRRLGCWQLAPGADGKYLHFDVERLRRFSEMLDPLLCPEPISQVPENSVESGGFRIL